MSATAEELELADELGDEAEAADANEAEPEDIVADARSTPEANAQATLIPFYNVASRADGQIRAQAGYHADGEIVRLAIDVTVGLTRAEQAHGLALGWYADAVRSAMAGQEEAEE